MRRGQVHRSRLMAVRTRRNAVAHELIVGHFSMRSKVDRIFGGKYVCCIFLVAKSSQAKSIALARSTVRLVAASALQAQIVETGVITGVVKDNTGAVIPGAHVTVRNTGTGLTTLTSTDAQGIYVTPPLHPGDYNSRRSMPLDSAKSLNHVRLEVGQRVAADAASGRRHRQPRPSRSSPPANCWRPKAPASAISAPKKPSGICL